MEYSNSRADAYSPSRVLNYLFCFIRFIYANVCLHYVILLHEPPFYDSRWVFDEFGLRYVKDTRDERISMFIRDGGKDSSSFSTYSYSIGIFLLFIISRTVICCPCVGKSKLHSFQPLLFNTQPFKTLIRHRKFNASTIAPDLFLSLFRRDYVNVGIYAGHQADCTYRTFLPRRRPFKMDSILLGWAVSCWML